MRRKFWILVHLYVAAFFAPAFLLVGISGGLYLVGVKGRTEATAVHLPTDVSLDPASDTLGEDVRRVLERAGIAHDFETIKRNGNTLITRPSSGPHYVFRVSNEGLKATHHVPDLQKRLIELHKGHGPKLFKQYQRVAAAGLLTVVLSGAWLGLSAAALRTRMWLATLVGAVLFALLISL